MNLCRAHGRRRYELERGTSTGRGVGVNRMLHQDRNERSELSPEITVVL